jgi:hypothetical protein
MSVFFFRMDTALSHTEGRFVIKLTDRAYCTFLPESFHGQWVCYLASKHQLVFFTGYRITHILAFLWGLLCQQQGISEPY